MKVDKHSEHMRYIDPICDCLYPLLHCLLGSAFVHLYSWHAVCVCVCVCVCVRERECVWERERELRTLLHKD